MVVFLAVYSRIPDDFYQVRDDGVITLSHAKNLVDYGFIGVGPSGPRVEGYSAPLQLYVYALVYRLFGNGYPGFCALQTVVCTFLLGLLLVRFLEGSRYLLLGLAALLAAFLTQQTSFFLWHASGLENPITHCVFLASVGVLGGFVARGKIRYAWAALLFMAAISRVDSVFHIAGLLVVFSVFWLAAWKDLRGLAFSSLVFVLWAGYQLWRYRYFGDLFPNTAYAQGTDLLGRSKELLALNRQYLDQGFKLCNRLLTSHGVYALIPFLPLLTFVRWSRRTAFFLLACAVLILSGYLYPLFFGRTFLDPARTTSHMALFVAFAMGVVLTSQRSRKILLWSGLAVAIPVLLVVSHTHEKPGYVCCSVDGFEKIHNELRDLGIAEDLPRPTIANPDLGAVSWHKDFNIVDLGMLASPFISRMQFGPLLSDYIFDRIAPDLIECHGSWSGRYYRTILTDKRFEKMYKPVRVEMTDLARASGGTVPSGIWIRRDILKGSGSRERRLIDDLRRSASIDRVAQELRSSRGEPGVVDEYVARTVYRFLPEFKRAGKLGELQEVLAENGASEFALSSVTGTTDGRANARGIDFLMNSYLEAELGCRLEDATPIIRSTFDVYLAQGKLIYLRKGRARSDTEGRFFVEFLPADGGDRYRRIEFAFREEGYAAHGRSLLVHELPKMEIKAIRTGQYLPNGPKVWEGSWEAGTGSAGLRPSTPAP
jgi:hypothetical protein